MEGGISDAFGASNGLVQRLRSRLRLSTAAICGAVLCSLCCLIGLGLAGLWLPTWTDFAEAALLGVKREQLESTTKVLGEMLGSLHAQSLEDVELVSMFANTAFQDTQAFTSTDPLTADFGSNDWSVSHICVQSVLETAGTWNEYDLATDTFGREVNADLLRWVSVPAGMETPTVTKSPYTGTEVTAHLTRLARMDPILKSMKAVHEDRYLNVYVGTRHLDVLRMSPFFAISDSLFDFVSSCGDEATPQIGYSPQCRPWFIKSESSHILCREDVEDRCSGSSDLDDCLAESGLCASRKSIGDPLKGAAVQTYPYLDSSLGDLVWSVSQSLIDTSKSTSDFDESMYGVAAIDIVSSFLEEDIASVVLDTSGGSYVFTMAFDTAEDSDGVTFNQINLLSYPDVTYGDIGNEYLSLNDFLRLEFGHPQSTEALVLKTLVTDAGFSGDGMGSFTYNKDGEDWYMDWSETDGVVAFIASPSLAVEGTGNDLAKRVRSYFALICVVVWILLSVLLVLAYRFSTFLWAFEYDLWRQVDAHVVCVCVDCNRPLREASSGSLLSPPRKMPDSPLPTHSRRSSGGNSPLGFLEGGRICVECNSSRSSTPLSRSEVSVSVISKRNRPPSPPPCASPPPRPVPRLHIPARNAGRGSSRRGKGKGKKRRGKKRAVEVEMNVVSSALGSDSIAAPIPAPQASLAKTVCCLSFWHSRCLSEVSRGVAIIRDRRLYIDDGASNVPQRISARTVRAEVVETEVRELSKLLVSFVETFPLFSGRIFQQVSSETSPLLQPSVSQTISDSSDAGSAALAPSPSSASSSFSSVGSGSTADGSNYNSSLTNTHPIAQSHVAPEPLPPPIGIPVSLSGTEGSLVDSSGLSGTSGTSVETLLMGGGFPSLVKAGAINSASVSLESLCFRVLYECGVDVPTVASEFTDGLSAPAPSPVVPRKQEVRGGVSSLEDPSPDDIDSPSPPGVDAGGEDIRSAASLQRMAVLRPVAMAAVVAEWSRMLLFAAPLYISAASLVEEHTSGKKWPKLEKAAVTELATFLHCVRLLKAAIAGLNSSQELSLDCKRLTGER